MMRAFLAIKAREARCVTTRTEDLASAVILVAIWIATAGVLDEAAFDDMAPILGDGAVFFVVILPAGLFRLSRR
jgi:hypothetical protein